MSLDSQALSLSEQGGTSSQSAFPSSRAEPFLALLAFHGWQLLESSASVPTHTTALAPLPKRSKRDKVKASELPSLFMEERCPKA